MGKLPWVAEVVAKAVVKFITNHHWSQALFREKSALDLLKPGDTRFATKFIMLDRMLEVRKALQELVVGREWREWNGKSNHSDDGDEVKDCVLRSGFWKNLEEVLALTKGTVALLRECDWGVPIAGLRGNVQLRIGTGGPKGQHLQVLSWDQCFYSEVYTGACNLNQISCASTYERNWSTYDFIHNKKRNRLRPDRANDLVEVFSNLHLISKVNNIEYEEQMVAWDRGEEELEEE